MGRWLLSIAVFVKALLQLTENLQQQRLIGAAPPLSSYSSLLLCKGKAPRNLTKKLSLVSHTLSYHQQLDSLPHSKPFWVNVDLALCKPFWVVDDGSFELINFGHCGIRRAGNGLDNDDHNGGGNGGCDHDEDAAVFHHHLASLHELGSSLWLHKFPQFCPHYQPCVVRTHCRRGNNSSLSSLTQQIHHHHHCHNYHCRHPSTARAYHALLVDFNNQDCDPSQVKKADVATKIRYISTKNYLFHQINSSSHKPQGGMTNSPSRKYGGISSSSHQYHIEGGLGLPHFHRDVGHLHYGNNELLLQSLCEQGQLDKALVVLSSVDRILPTSLYLSLFKLCSKNRSATQARQIHGHIVRNNVSITGFLGDYLVMALAKCGAVEDAYQISAMLPQRTVFSWTAMISAKVDAGSAQEALQMFQSMQEEGIEPNNYTFVSLFKACGITRDLLKGKEIHKAASRKGFVSDAFVCSALVSFYSKCGAIAEAEDVFCSSPQSDVVSWNAMIAAFVECEAGFRALKLYRQMQEEGVRPDDLTMVLTLQACGALAEKSEGSSSEESLARATVLQIGRALHADVIRVNPSLFVHNTLVSMYGKCGAVVEAEHVFGAISHRSFVSWNAMLAAYLQEDECEKVLLLFRQMQKEGISPVQHTFLFAVQACGILAEKTEAVLVEGQPIKITALKIGEALHGDARKNNFESDAFVGTSLLSMYGKCGAIMEAECVFLALPYRDEVSWNAMLSMYIEQRHGEKALKLYRQMNKAGLTADKVGIVLALQACCILIDKEGKSVEEAESLRVMPLEIGESLHAIIRQRGFAPDVNLGSILISMYARVGVVLKAENVFMTFFHRDVVLWSVMLSAYVEQGLGGRALRLYQQMLKEGVSPDPHALVYALQACMTLTKQDVRGVPNHLSIETLTLEIGRALHADACSRGFASNLHVGNALVSMYGKCDAFEEAEDAFGAITQGNIVSWNAMLSVYIEHGFYDKVLWLYTHIKEQRLVMDNVTFVCILQACRLAGNWEVCTHLHFVSASAGWDQVLSVAASFIHAYGNCGGVLDAQAVVNGLLRPDVVSWNALSDGHTGGGDFIGSLCVLETFELVGSKPDDVTFISGLSVCSHTGMVHEGLEYFESMTRDYGIIASMKHYGNLIDLLGRAGDFKRIENMLRKMPMEASCPMWLCLLGSCSTHGNIELARRAFDHAVKLQPKESAAYIVMSNMYIDAGLQGGAAGVENLRRYHGASESLAGARGMPIRV